MNDNVPALPADSAARTVSFSGGVAELNIGDRFQIARVEPCGPDGLYEIAEFRPAANYGPNGLGGTPTIVGRHVQTGKMVEFCGDSVAGAVARQRKIQSLNAAWESVWESGARDLDEKPMRITYEIENGGDPASGMPAYQEEVHIEVHTGDPGGDLGEFQEYMRAALSEWFDGARVSVVGTSPALPPNHRVILRRSEDQKEWQVVVNPQWNYFTRAENAVLFNDFNAYVERSNCGCVYRMIRAKDWPNYGTGDLDPAWTLDPGQSEAV